MRIGAEERYDMIVIFFESKIEVRYTRMFRQYSN